jgi:hypothetical protein
MVFERIKAALTVSEEEFITKKQRDHEHLMREVTQIDALFNESPYSEFTPQ